MASHSSASRTITFTRKSGNFISHITCDQGDVYVDFKDETSTDNSNYTPLYSTSNPRVLELNIINSLNIPFVVQSVVWKANGENVTADRIKNAYVAEDNGLSLRIKGSIAALSGNQSITIVAEATVVINGMDTTIVRASYYIPVRQTDGNNWHVMIAACDNKCNYTLKNDASSIDIKCIVYNPEGNEADPSQYKYKWYKHQNGIWNDYATNEGTNIVTIHRDDVDNQAMFKVEVFAPDGVGYSSVPLGMDTQMIYDAMDFYTLLITPSSEETIEQGSNAQIDYCVSVYNSNEQRNAREARISFYLHAYGVIPVRSVTDLLWKNSFQKQVAEIPTGETEMTYGPLSPMFYVNEQDFNNNGGTALTLDINAQIIDG